MYKKSASLSSIMILLIFITFSFIYISCSKEIEIKPPVNAEDGSAVFNKDNTAAAFLTGIYIKLSNDQYFSGTYGISASLGLSSDEFDLLEGASELHRQLYTNSLKSDNISSSSWVLYKYIYDCNLAIEGLTAAQSLTVNVKNQLIGEAKFIRAFCYFYLTNLFGEVPIVISSDYHNNMSLKRSSQHEVYLLVEKDLLEAKLLLSESYLRGDAISKYNSGTEERVRPTRWAASALLARTYLFMKNWGKAESEASLVINNTTLFSLVDLNDVFRKNSREAIFQIQPTAPQENTKEGLVFQLDSTGPNISKPISISSFVMSEFMYEDPRRSVWIDSVIFEGKTYYFPNKYKIGLYNKPIEEYLTVIRLAEVYIIRAEAKIRLNRVGEGVADLNVLRDRAIRNTGSSLSRIDENLNTANAIRAVVKERQLELFSEWGNRWLDLKRLPGFMMSNISLADELMPSVTNKKGGQWNSNWRLYPIPYMDIVLNPSLSPNNPGY